MFTANDNNVVLDLGPLSETCASCRALVWPAEFTGRHVGQSGNYIQYVVVRARSSCRCCISPRRSYFNCSLVMMRQQKHMLIEVECITLFLYFVHLVERQMTLSILAEVHRVTGQVYHNLGSFFCHKTVVLYQGWKLQYPDGQSFLHSRRYII